MTEILTPHQSKFLHAFFEHTQAFYLTGGTALSAYYLQHRYSLDLDFFTQQDEAFEDADEIVNRSCATISFESTTVRSTSYFRHFRVGTKDTQVTLHFSRDYAKQIKSPNRFGEVIVDSIEDITVNKICAALGRTENKDLIDLYFLHHAGYTIPDYFEPAQEKDGGLSEDTLAYTLSQFRISEIPSFVIKPLRLDSLNDFLETTIKWLIEISAPPT